MKFLREIHYYESNENNEFSKNYLMKSIIVQVYVKSSKIGIETEN